MIFISNNDDTDKYIFRYSSRDMVYFKVTAKDKQVNFKHNLRVNPHKKTFSQKLKGFRSKISNFFRVTKRKCRTWKRRNF